MEEVKIDSEGSQNSQECSANLDIYNGVGDDAEYFATKIVSVNGTEGKQCEDGKEAMENMDLDIHSTNELQIPSFIQLGVEGMTCQSCVRAIEESVSNKPGILAIKVNLKSKCASVTYNSKVTNPGRIQDDINEMGFSASLLGSFSEVPEDSISITVTGMTCKSCVQNIETIIGSKPGVINIKVSLEKNMAKILYNTSIVTPEELCSAIEDMGFEASLNSECCAILHVEGMTCISYVENIERILSEKLGVLSVKVELNTKEAKVIFNSADTSGEKIVGYISDMGFEAHIKNMSGSSLGKGWIAYQAELLWAANLADILANSFYNVYCNYCS